MAARREGSPFPPVCSSRYEPIRRLAIGGFGSIHLAIQRDLGRQVAVKLLNTDFTGDLEQLERFRVEARATAALSHENIVIVHDHDVEGDVAWIVYELLAGPDLRGVLSVGPLDWRRTVQLGMQMASALELAHQAGILHRDVKPENVIRAGEGWYTITDFGIARWRRDGGGVRTRDGVILGTPRYMAPEAILREAVGPPADVYALGVLLFETLIGEPPFPDTNPVETLTHHLRTAPPAPRSLRDDLPPAADAILLQALAKAPGDRFRGMADLRSRLEDAWRLLPTESDGDLVPLREGTSARDRRADTRALEPEPPGARPRASTRLAPSAPLPAGSPVVAGATPGYPARAAAGPGCSRASIRVVAVSLLSIGLFGLVAARWGPRGPRSAGDLPAPPGSTALLPAPAAAGVDIGALIREYEGARPELLAMEHTLRSVPWSDRPRAIETLRNLQPRAREQYESLRSLVGRLPPDGSEPGQLGDRELDALVRTRTWLAITWHRLQIVEGLTAAMERWARTSGLSSVLQRNLDYLEGTAVPGERQGILFLRQAFILIHEELRRVLADPEIPRTRLAETFEDLAHMSWPFLHSHWHQGGDDATHRELDACEDRLRTLEGPAGQGLAQLATECWRIGWSPRGEGPDLRMRRQLRVTIRELAAVLPGQATSWQDLERTMCEPGPR